MIKKELYEIPYRSELCYRKNKGIILPEEVPYIGMGASYFAASAFRYLGINLYPENAAAFHHYLNPHRKFNNGVLISQSGQSSETLWCANHFETFIALVNEEKSPLGSHPSCAKQYCLHAGHEERITTKTYLNTLMILYLGFGFDPKEVIQVYKKEMAYFEQLGSELGEMIRKRIRGLHRKCIYILGNGPNRATADVAALVLSEVLKIPVLSMSASEYDHGFKETSKNVLAIAINHKGPESQRTRELLKTIKAAGADVFELSDPRVDNIYSPLTFPLAFFFAAEYLSYKRKIHSIFQVGKKVTRVKNP